MIYSLTRIKGLQNYETPLVGAPAFVAQRIEHLTTDQKVGGSSPSKRTGIRFGYQIEGNFFLKTENANSSF